MDERVSVFIDGSNLDRSVSRAFEKRVSVEKVARKLGGGRRLMKVYYYEAPLIADVDRSSFDGQQRFFERLRRDPYFDIRLGRRVQREKEFKCPTCEEITKFKTWEQKGVDTLLVFDLISLAMRNAYDTAIVVTGDEDFIAPFLEIRMLGKMVENAFTKVGWAPRLRQVADKCTELTESFLEECWR